MRARYARRWWCLSNGFAQFTQTHENHHLHMQTNTHTPTKPFTHFLKLQITNKQQHQQMSENILWCFEVSSLTRARTHLMTHTTILHIRQTSSVYKSYMVTLHRIQIYYTTYVYITLRCNALLNITIRYNTLH